MQTRILARETGDLKPQDFARSLASDLIRTFAPAPQHRFNGEILTSQGSARGGPSSVTEERAHNTRAHGAGVTALDVDKFDGRLMISGGADGSVKIWDLESASSPHTLYTFQPTLTIARSTQDARSSGNRGHSHGVTHLAFYPFDSGAFLSSSFDKTLKLWSTPRAALSAEFPLNATIYSHATSPVADHLLVACATQHSNVRLVDLKSGAAVQALVAHGGPVLSTAWSPRQEHILASGHADGKVRIWDIRRAGGAVAQLDQEDSLGVVHRFTLATANGADWDRQPHYRASSQAHDEAVNAIKWSDDGRYIVTAGLDRKIRVWDADTGANTLASFGSVIQNQHPKTASMLLSPSGLCSKGDALIWANDQEMLVLNMHDGTVITRLRSPGMTNPVGPRSAEIGRNRITTMAWRGAGGSGYRTLGPVMGGAQSLGTIYSAHLDGRIRTWMVTIPGPDDVDDIEEMDEDEEVRSRKRKAVDDAYKSLMGKKITFT
ncbi:DNA excision repair protein ERCC-8 [Cordyceps fumosorosea ARSEF 2679]|uniref:DNA excision repair protein ERCC-8 n=1 Tax=Cordyceps fumosorosea (strain ARSEF 2679) TaxID=1081104 RepID=A0A167TM47_CORFA|nr:DNA excision repair protein ERCC-8 [Cordyceps fumosorosea ARSEF 2679]OAA60739.1 DNA excision repair protein ERCC-8 [Cordyceps fumosorosea ARSEF 2679]